MSTPFSPFAVPETRYRSLSSSRASAVQSPTLLMVVLLATIGIVAYSWFLFDPAHRGDVIPYALVITAELVLVAQALLSMWTILSGTIDPRDFSFHQARDYLFAGPGADDRGDAPASARPLHLRGEPVEIDVFVTVCGEDVEIVRRTVAAAVAMHGAHTTWVLDDGGSDEVLELAAQFEARYVRREGSEHAKAGNVNHGLGLATGEFFALFDADFVPRFEFLTETIPFFSDSMVAFVQTPQSYGNLRNLISRGAGYMQSVFYKLIQPGRNSFNAAFCVGTNVVFRRSAIDEIDGLYTGSKSEDVWTSLLLHERGWRSVYIPAVLAVGDAPETIEAYTKQQLRWASGGFEILLHRNPFSPRRTLTTDQRIQYFITATHYLVGATPALLLLVPPLGIYFDMRPVNLDVTVGVWVVYYLGFYGLQVMLAFNSMGSFRLETLMLSTVSFPIYLRAFVNVLLGRSQQWHATGSLRGTASPFTFMIPQVLCFVFLALTSLVAIYKDSMSGTFTLALAWNLTNTIILAVFIAAAFRESAAARRHVKGVTV